MQKRSGFPRFTLLSVMFVSAIAISMQPAFAQRRQLSMRSNASTTDPAVSALPANQSLHLAYRRMASLRGLGWLTGRRHRRIFGGQPTSYAGPSPEGR